MKKSDFHFDLPAELIAAYPANIRSESRLLHLDCASGEITHRHFYDLPDLLDEQDLLVHNNTKVIPARLLGHKETGGQVEILIERTLDNTSVLAQIRSSKSMQSGSKIILERHAYKLQVEGRVDDFYQIKFPQPGVTKILDQSGEIPLPPYIDRHVEDLDRERYQTVYASKEGAVAAPTAGLHFDDDLLLKLDQKGIASAYLTLHVGAGTFQPVRSDDLRKHKMHSESFEIDKKTCAQINASKRSSGRIIAVGSTSVRSLEAAAKEAAKTQSSKTATVQPFKGETDIFIYPGYEFQMVDAMITNFHLPESTLIMLISAFAGLDKIKKAYQLAIEEKYRFYSYGDAMLITR